MGYLLMFCVLIGVVIHTCYSLRKETNKSSEATKIDDELNKYEFSMYVYDDKEKLSYIHCFDGIYTNGWNGFADYQVYISTRNSTPYKFKLVHNETGKEKMINKSSFTKGGYSLSEDLKQFINSCYAISGEKQFFKKAICIDKKNNRKLKMEFLDEYQERSKKEMIAMMKGDNTNNTDCYFRDVFSSWFD